MTQPEGSVSKSLDEQVSGVATILDNKTLAVEHWLQKKRDRSSELKKPGLRELAPLVLKLAEIVTITDDVKVKSSLWWPFFFTVYLECTEVRPQNKRKPGIWG